MKRIYNKIKDFVSENKLKVGAGVIGLTSFVNSVGCALAPRILQPEYERQIYEREQSNQIKIKNIYYIEAPNGEYVKIDTFKTVRYNGKQYCIAHVEEKGNEYILNLSLFDHTGCNKNKSRIINGKNLDIVREKGKSNNLSQNNYLPN